MHLVSKAWTILFQSASRVHVLEDGGDKRLEKLIPAGKADGVAPQDPALSGQDMQHERKRHL